MDHYWENAGALQPPPAPTATQGTYPTDGNLPAAVAPSTPGAWWYHQITEEIRNVIVKFGGVPDFRQVNQLATFISQAIASSGNAITSSLSKVATTGQYADLLGKPSIPPPQVNSDWNAGSGVAMILNKPPIQAPLGFTPVEQGGGIGQGNNKVYIGWDGSGLRGMIDSTDEGHFVFEAELQANVNNLQNQIDALEQNSGGFTSLTFVGRFTGSWSETVPGSRPAFYTATHSSGDNQNSSSDTVSVTAGVNGNVVAVHIDNNQTGAKECSISWMAPPGANTNISSTPYNGGAGTFNVWRVQ